MKHRIGRVVSSIFVLTAVLFGQETTENIVQKADSLLADAVDKGIFSGLVVISHNGKEIYFRQAGYADWNSKRPIERNTLFNIGSLNKQFTEEMIHQLVKEKKITYEDRLSQYLDLFPPEVGNAITIQHLLDMQAGLGDYLLNPEFEAIRFTDFSIKDLLNIIKRERLLFQPGTGRRYSNSGYVVLGAVIEHVTGKSYEENLRERIIKPLGLNHIFYTRAEKERQPSRAFGTAIDFEGNKKCTDDIANSTPAGGIYTDAADLLKFTEAKLRDALPSGKVYTGATVAGGTPLWNSTISFNKENGFAVVVMANMGNIADAVAARLNAIINKEPMQPLELPFTMKLYRVVVEDGEEYVKAHAPQLAEQARLPYDDRFLNYFGYEFLNAGRTDIALKLFQVNVELFPSTANTYDSLAEAYLRSGNKVNALKYYKMALERDPGNSRIRKTIEDLER